MRALMRGYARRRCQEAGYVAIVGAIFISTLGMGCAALGVDTARLWVEAARVQKAADMASLAGVTYMPQDFDTATSTAIDVATRNGYPNDAANGTTVTTSVGSKASELEVTVCGNVTNNFGAVIGVSSGNVCRSAVADYTGPAPMGSPCNTFGNEPSSGGTSSAPAPTGTARGSAPFANCKAAPSMWGTVEGPQVAKEQGDRYGTLACGSSSVDGCDSSSKNSENRKDGYYWLIRVQPNAVGKQIDLQLYDPTFANTGTACTSSVPDAASFSDSANPYVADGRNRYGKPGTQWKVGTTTYTAGATSTGVPFCSGDYYPGGGSTVPVTSFAVRQQTDTLNPATAPVQNADSSAGGGACIAQFSGQSGAPSVNDLTSTSTTYDQQLASTFHNWYSLCKFTPSRAGDYYVQVRTNVAMGGTCPANTKSNPIMICTGNTNVVGANATLATGYGNNAFSLRAVVPSGSENQVSVSGYDRMPIFVNAASGSTFNLIRVGPGAAGKTISFSYFDIGDASGNGGGSVQVTTPSDATGSITSTPFPGGCKAAGGNAGSSPITLSNCTAPFTNTSNNGFVETITIPIPSDYNCTYSSLGGCWYQVKLNFNAGTTVTDITTWTANINGDPVRLIE